jgi:hypothetical protein
VGVENFHSVSEWGPEILKTAIEDVFQRVTVVLIQCHPGMFFGVVDCKVYLGYKSVGERDTLKTQRNWMPRTRNRR